MMSHVSICGAPLPLPGPAGVDERAQRGASMLVLIAYDESSDAELAIALAGALRWPSESKLQVAAVVEPVLPHYTGVRPMGVAVPPPEIDPAMIEQRQRQVSDAAARLSGDDHQAEGVV